MLDFIICASTNLFRMYLIDRFVTAFLGKLKENKIKKFLVYACFYVVNMALFWEFRTVWINVLCNLAGIGMIVWLHTKSPKILLFVTCSIYLINMGCDVAIMLSAGNYTDGERYSQVYEIIVVFLFLVCELVTEKIITSLKSTETFPNTSLIFVPLCSIAVIFLLIYSNACTDQGIAIVSMGMLIVNFSMLYLYNLLLHSVSQKYETEMLRQKVQIYANQIDIILQSEEKIKALKHDMNNHLHTISGYMQVGEYEKAQEYVGEIAGEVSRIQSFHSGNAVVDALIGSKTALAEMNGIKVDVDMAVPAELNLTDGDLTVMIGNLYDNAIDANLKITDEDKRFIHIKILSDGGNLLFLFENAAYEGERSGKVDVWATTKKDSFMHGFGIQNIDRIVQMYGGYCERELKNHVFRCRIRIPGK